MISYKNIRNLIIFKTHLKHINNIALYTTNAKIKILQKNIKNGPGLKEFIQKDNSETISNDNTFEFENSSDLVGDSRKRNVYFDVYGCQMNVSDTEVAYSILNNTGGYTRVYDETEADIILIMTCSIREGAEKKIWTRLEQLHKLKTKRSDLQIGILGCMAERLKETIVEKQKLVDVICGPDAYRSLPELLNLTYLAGNTAMNVQLSLDETYADISPLRINSQAKTAFVSIQRGCDNMCSFCIVPYVRGRERSRPISSILDEIRKLSDSGIKDVTLLGQNVNSYRDLSEVNFSLDINNTNKSNNQMSKDFKTVYKPKIGGKRFSDLLDAASRIDPNMRIRFTSPHPKDFPDELLFLMKERPNICKQIHLPAQSGSTTCLERMRRGYTREAYLNLVNRIREVIPNVALTSDFIAGFCGETEEEHKDTISLMEIVKYNFCFTFPYSMREKTKAFYHLKDDVQQDTKSRRHIEITETFRKYAFQLNSEKIGQIHLIAVEGESKRSNLDYSGRNDNNTSVVFSKCEIPKVENVDNLESLEGKNKVLPKPGDYVACKIIEATSQTLRGIPLFTCSLTDFYSKNFFK